MNAIRSWPSDSRCSVAIRPPLRSSITTLGNAGCDVSIRTVGNCAMARRSPSSERSGSEMMIRPVELMAWNFHQSATGAVGGVDVVQHDLETVRLQRLHDAAQALVRGRLVEERHQHADESLALRPAPGGRTGRAVVQFLHRGMHLGPRRRADLIAAVEHARHRPDAHPCPSRNVGNGCHVVTSPLRLCGTTVEA